MRHWASGPFTEEAVFYDPPDGIIDGKDLDGFVTLNNNMMKSMTRLK